MWKRHVIWQAKECKTARSSIRYWVVMLWKVSVMTLWICGYTWV